MVAATHVATAPLWLAGVLGLVLAPRLAPGRVLGLALFPLLGVFVWQVWEPRPLLPVFPLLVAAGAVVVASLTRLGGRRWLRVAVCSAVVVPLVAAAPLRRPLLEPSAVRGYAAVMAPLASWPQAAATELPVPAALSRMLGWREQAKAARRAFELLPRTERERAVVWARSRYQAAAMDRLGERYGLPRALSGDGDYRRWSDGAGDADPVVTIGFTTAELQPWFRSVREGAVANCDLCVPERQRVSVHLCGDARLPTDKLRDEMARAGP